jgi:hypothetical protein
VQVATSPTQLSSDNQRRIGWPPLANATAALRGDESLDAQDVARTVQWCVDARRAARASAVEHATDAASAIRASMRVADEMR